MKKGHNHLTEASSWTEEEDRKLIEYAATLPKQRGGKRLMRNTKARFADCFVGRSEMSVFSRYKLIKQRLARTGQWKPGFYVRRWTQEEEAKLREVYSRDKHKLDLQRFFPDRDINNVIAKAARLGLARTKWRLPIIPFRLSSEDAAMAAGLILGDGTIGRYKYKGKPDSWTICVGFSNTEKVLVDWFVERVPRGNVTARSANAGNPEKWGIRSRKPSWVWRLADKTTLCLFLEQIYPYLLGEKKEKAAMILKQLVPIIAKDIADKYAA